MDERTKATVRALLDRYPRGYAAAKGGFAATNTGAGLFRLLCLSILADDSVPSTPAIDGTQALVDSGWLSAPEMAKSDDNDRADALAKAAYPDCARAARHLGEATKLVVDRYGSDLENLRKAAHGDARRLRELLREIPGMDDAGCAVFLREVQMFWPEAGPFVDEHAANAARRLDLPADLEKLLADMARGGGQENLAWLVGALALVDARKEYERVRAA